MTDTGRTTESGAPRSARNGSFDQPGASAWAGWISFAAVMMLLLGVFQIIEGLVALLNRGYYIVGANLVVNVDYTAWGWLHLILGVVVLFAGFGVMAGQTAARVLGVVLAVLSAIVNLAFIAAYPLWSIVVIAVDIIVIYALAAHGREVRA